MGCSGRRRAAFPAFLAAVGDVAAAVRPSFEEPELSYPFPALMEIAEAAGAAIMQVYRSDFDVRRKADASPLTQADLAAHEVISSGLERLSPRLPILSEESSPPPYGERRRWRRYWLVDPLDGTKEFINRNGEFTVNFALIEDGRARLGVVGAPVLKQVFIGDAADRRAEKHAGGAVTPLAGRSMQGRRSLTLVASRSHGNERLQPYLEALDREFAAVAHLAMGSSLKLCLLAEGKADLYPRLGPTSEWDIAAADAVLAAAGGALYQLNGAPLAYNKRDLLNPDFVAVADAAFPWAEKLPKLQ